MYGAPLPPIDLFKSIVDILAKRYGWSYVDIADNMYWEDVYEMFIIASNHDAIEKNESMRFQFLLHATSQKQVDSWKDSKIPYPKLGWKEPIEQMVLPERLAKARKRTTKTPEQEKRFREVQQKLSDFKRHLAETKSKNYGR